MSQVLSHSEAELKLFTMIEDGTTSDIFYRRAKVPAELFDQVGEERVCRRFLGWEVWTKRTKFGKVIITMVLRRDPKQLLLADVRSALAESRRWGNYVVLKVPIDLYYAVGRDAIGREFTGVGFAYRRTIFRRRMKIYVNC